MRLLRVSYSSPKEHYTLLLKVQHVSTLRNPKYLTPTYWRSRCRFHQRRDSRQKSVHLLIVGEQLFQPYTYVSVSLYLHFHVVNPTFAVTCIICDGWPVVSCPPRARLPALVGPLAFAVTCITCDKFRL